MSAALYETFAQLPDLPGAACRDHDPDLWDDTPADMSRRARRYQVRHAKQICNTCPVKAECLEYAMTSEIRHGIWGGLATDERLALRRGRPTSASNANWRRRCTTGQHMLPTRSNYCRSCQRARKAERARGGTPVLGPPCPTCKLGKIRCTHREITL